MVKERMLQSICREHELSIVYLFGSQAERGAEFLQNDDERATVNDPLADLDVGVVTAASLPEPSERHNLYASLHNDLQDCFPGFRIDLVLLQEHHSVFQSEALKGICVYTISEDEKDQYEMSILRRSADFRPVLDLFLREALEEVTT